jgi:leucine dehydrogenase
VEGPFARLDGHEQVIFGNDDETGLRCIIAIHSTRLGPSLGGTRFHDYPDEEAALTDVLRLSKAMTYKAACAGLDLGGGKAVIIGDPRTKRREMLFRAHGRFVETLKGRYITAEDVGTSVEDMDYVHMETEYVTGLAGRSGDPSPVTFSVDTALRSSAQSFGASRCAARIASMRALLPGSVKLGFATRWTCRTASALARRTQRTPTASGLTAEIGTTATPRFAAT